MKKKMIAIPKTLIAAVLVLLSTVGVFLGSFKNAPPADPAFGAIPGNEVQGNEFVVGGLLTRQVKIAMITGTTTPCAIQSPSATSTLQHVSVTTTTASSSAYTIQIAKSATRYATTTSLGNNAYSAGVRGTLVGTRVSAGADGALTFAPNQWVVVGLEGGTPKAGGGGGEILGDNTRGTCQAFFVADM